MVIITTESLRYDNDRVIADNLSVFFGLKNVPAGHPPQHASNGIGGGLSPHFAGSLQPRHSVKHASVVSKRQYY